LSFIIYHNPRCRKSRETLAILSDHSGDFEIIEYLKTPLSKSKLKTIIDILGITAEQLLRKGESDFKVNFKGKDLSENECLDAMVKFPKLIERPIVIKGNKAIIGRPPENVKDLF